ncbi:MAG: hypothetical protein LBV50_07735 [Novosphingobium sp.]|nr:hypothetical protein [Novosphingobium sp.]
MTRQLKARAVTVKTGTLVDAAIIASASEGDDDARWVLLEKPDDPGHAGHPNFANFAHSGHGELFAAAGNMTDNQRLRR